MFENRVLRRAFGPKRVEVPGEQGAVGNSIVRSFTICRVQQLLLGRSKEGERYESGKWHVRAEERRVQSLVRKVEGKRLIGRQRRRWGDNIEIAFKGIGRNGL